MLLRMMRHTAPRPRRAPATARRPIAAAAPVP
jgi:hypothetical protein